MAKFTIFSLALLFILLQLTHNILAKRQVLYWMGLERTHENITHDLNDILERAREGEFTQISYEAYNLGEFSSFVDNHFSNVLPLLKKANLQTFPMITTVNIPYLQELLNNETTMDRFIIQAVENQKNIDTTGYNIDFEPIRNDITTQLAPNFVKFLNRFADSLHLVGKKLTVCIASWSFFWDWNLLSESRVDKIITMDTYAARAEQFDSAFKKAVTTIPIRKLGLGLMIDSRVNQTELGRRISMIENSGIDEIDVWQYQDVPEFWFNELEKFVKNN
ncbi:predicted protein [Naegleria gruberi]|uniref:Predicted protein n=1 Tax=Naegleria gruberi TaxID=5762 RepID=D2W509_NAEGR|nr:uncharacterized protein NAEGRDRAFT_76497 [Naegleria gruberi]EFC35845.1 predicted protein [Naegleria gruberi]|eukprot:XP_002668589.1 predicted protein [Naegleria gruberi strain NEG-M]